MDDTILGVAEVTPEVEREMRAGYVVRQKLAIARQERINADARRVENRIIPDFGERVCRVDPVIFFHFARRYGAECWSDRDFMDDCFRKGLVQRERSRSDKTTVRVNGLNKRQGTQRISGSSRIVSANRFGGVSN